MNERTGTRSEIVATLVDGDGNIVRRYPPVTNFLCELGEAHIADQLSDAPDDDPMSHMAIGTGSGQLATEQTLDNEVARVALDSAEQGDGTTNPYLQRVVRDNEAIYTCTFAAGTGTGTITEFAIFNAASTGVMLNYASGFSWPKGASQDLVVVMALTIGVS